MTKMGCKLAFCRGMQISCVLLVNLFEYFRNYAHFVRDPMLFLNIWYVLVLSFFFSLHENQFYFSDGR